MELAFTEKQAALLIRLVQQNPPITVLEYLNEAEDVEADKYRVEYKEFCEKCGETIRIHEDKHAAVYRQNGIDVEYYLNESKNIGFTCANKESLLKWLSKHKQENQLSSYLNLIRDVVTAPGTDMSLSDICQQKILCREIKSVEEYKKHCAIYPT